MTTSLYITQITNGVLSLVDDTPSSSKVLGTNEYFCMMFCTEYHSFLRNYVQFKGDSNYNDDLDLYDIDINKQGYKTGYYISKEYNRIKRMLKQVRENKGRIIVVSVNDNSKVIFLDGSTIGLQAPLATAATDYGTGSFTANWNVVSNAIGYKLSLYYNSSLTVAVDGFEDLDVDNVLSYDITGLTYYSYYYYVIKAYDNNVTSVNSNTIVTSQRMGNIPTDIDDNEYDIVRIGDLEWMTSNLKVTKYADGTAIPNLTENEYNDWFLPSSDLLEAIYNNIHLAGLGGFSNEIYWTSTEFSGADAVAIDFTDGSVINWTKDIEETYVRACRLFTDDIGAYNLGDTGPAGGLICYIDGTTYYEVAPTDQSTGKAWTDVAVGIVLGGTTGNVEDSESNTLLIIGQVGHTDSAAKVCNDLSLGGWNTDTEGAYCAYDNDPLNIPDYGLLYNWYAVDNAHGLAPEGWRIPTYQDMLDLINVLGGISVAGGKLKEVGLTHWDSPNTGATDEYGFNGRGASYRESGIFGTLKRRSAFWSSTEEWEDTQAYYMNLFHDSAVCQTYGIGGNLNTGFSVRCVRDAI